jgi:putative tryptophan/tyrosine transport system substrate-binding protein
MRRSAIGLLVTLALSLLMAPLAVAAQPPTKVYRVGRLITAFAPSQPSPILEAFEQTLRDLGYVEGRNVILEYRYAEGSEERLRDQAAELVQLPVDVIVAQGAAAIRAAQHATRTIPIVMAATADPVGLGFVASLAHPGGNITGLSFLGEELLGSDSRSSRRRCPRARALPCWPIRPFQHMRPECTT